MKTKIQFVLVVFALALLAISPFAFAASAKKSAFYLDGDVVKVGKIHSKVPKKGTAPLYVVTNGITGQLPIASAGPGDKKYKGGAWAVYTVTFTNGITPRLLTSDEAVNAALAAGHITVTRNASLDYKAPINGKVVAKNVTVKNETKIVKNETKIKPVKVKNETGKAPHDTPVRNAYGLKLKLLK